MAAWLDNMGSNLLGYDPAQLKGLLEEADLAKARQSTLLGLSQGLLSASGPSRMPINFGQAFAQATAQGQQAGQGTIQQAMMLRQAQEQRAQRKAEAERMIQVRELLAKGNPQGAAALQGDVSGYVSATPKPTAQPDEVQKYQFAKSQGYQGTFEDWVLTQRRAGATNVNVDTKGAPDGYTWVDPANPKAGLKPIPGGPRDPNTLTETQRNQNREFEGFGNVLTQYEAALQQYGPQLGPTVSAMEIRTPYKATIAAAKNLFKLGALSKDDLKLVEGILIDPTSAEAQVLGKDALMRNAQAVRRILQGLSSPTAGFTSSQPPPKEIVVPY